MRKIVFEHPTTLEQQLILVDQESGGVVEGVKVLWDENLHGPIPQNIEASLGGLILDNKGKTVVDQNKLDAFENKKLEDQDKKAANKLVVKDGFELFKDLDLSVPLSKEDLDLAVRTMIAMVSVK